MQNPQGVGIAIEPEDRNDTYRSMVADVISLIEHVQASLRLIEHEIARETASGSQDNCANVIVLDDVTPSYVRATVALKACDANLAVALHSLLDPMASRSGSGDSSGSLPTLLIVSA
ncbi:hypothetical protein LJR220_002748 [Bradyrhizobium sp. LjRoot220]|uniref:hypothetical protein n=1 Tax=Bradyrhizobium sp. LjRoot220 TaxID=3342284 RepID=UPI003ECF4860